MKNRRLAVVAILLVAVLCVGVGYAAWNDTINATGTIEYDPSFNITWGEITNGTATVDNVAGTGTDNLTFTVDTTDWALNEAKTFTIVVNGDSKYGAENIEVQSLVTTNVDAYYDVSAEVTGDTEIPAGGTTTVTVTITMTAYPLADAEYAQTFTFSVYADQVVS